jgi:cytochrome c oxidase assembly protein subunit 15
MTSSTYHSGIHKFAVFTVCWTILLFVAGALVTSNDAALSVIDWPKSHGSWVPPLSSLQGGDFYEFSHRFVAGGLGIFTLLLAVLLVLRERRVWLRWLGVIAVLGVVVQAILGGQVVMQLLHYWLPVIHACFAQIVFAAVLAIAVFTSKWWVSERPQLEDKGSPSIHFVATLNAVVVYLQVILGAGFRHKDIPIWPHAAGALVVLGTVTWTAVALRRRLGASRELGVARILLHAIFGIQFLLGLLAYWSRRTTAEAPQPMPVMVWLTVIHTVVGAILFAFSVLVVLMCYRLVPRGGEVASTEPQVSTG